MPDESFEDKMKISKDIRENLIKADKLIKEEKLGEAANYYKAAAELSNRLGHTEIARDYLNKANKLIESMGGAVKADELSIDPMEDVMKRADKALEGGKFGDAAKIYEKAARHVPKEAERLLAEAIELRKKEKNLYIARKEIHRKADGINEYETTLEKIKAAIEQNQNQKLVTLYGRAAILAERMGKREQAGEFRKDAIEAKRKVIKDRRLAPKEGRRGVVKQYTELLTQIKHYLDEKLWQEAADAYLQAAQLAYELEEYDNAKRLKEKAANIQKQADILEHATHLKQKERDLLQETEKLNREKDTEKILQNYVTLTELYKEIDDPERLNKVNENLKLIRKIKDRQESLNNANLAMETENYSKALDLFQNALRISMDLNELTKAEGFKNIIKELQGKVDMVARSRQMIEQRAELIASAKAAVKEVPPNIAVAINNYKEAARISFELDEKELANSYLQTAKKIEEDKGLIVERENFIKDAEAAVKEKNFLLASKYYEQAAKFSEKIGDGTEDKYRKKASALKDLAEEL